MKRQGSPSVDQRERDIQSILREFRIDVKEAQRRTRESREFLRRILADGPRPAREVLELAHAQGINEVSLRRAKRRLGILSIKQSFNSDWVWTPGE